MSHFRESFTSVPVFLFATALLSNAQPLPPAMVNYSEGQVELAGQAVTPQSAEMAAVYQGDTLRTQEGRAELLLTPGVFLRVGNNSAIKLDAVSAGRVKLELLSGEAIVEVDQVDQKRHLEMADEGAGAQFDRSGLFGFNMLQRSITVYKGRLRVEDDRRNVEIKSGEQLFLNQRSLKPLKVDFAETDSLYAWSRKRADYASQVSEWTSEALLALDGRPEFTDGWYWNSWYKSWAFIPVKRYVLTPFGYGIYAPREPHSVTPVFGDFRN